jgi:Flp pilus assembly CpaE family ATPase
VSIPVLTAADGAAWESRLIAAATAPVSGLRVSRRCVDVVELLAVAAAGQGLAALVDARLRRFDADAVDRLTAAGVAIVGVVEPWGATVVSGATAEPTDADAAPEPADRTRLAAAGVEHFVPSDAEPDVLASVVAAAVAEIAGHGPTERGFGDPVFATGPLTSGPPVSGPTPMGSAGIGAGGFDAVPPNGELSGPPDAATRAPGGRPAGRRGSVIAVWGPTGAPGRTTVALALADELSRLSPPVLVADADVYGGVIASALGLLDESPGLAAACRQAQSRRLDRAGLAALAWQVSPGLSALTGISRADRWPELRPSAVESVLSVARTLAEFTVVDLGFALESDEELSFDTLAPRRNGATLAVLDDADLVLAVASADPVGIQRLVRGLAELREVEVSAPVWIVLNRVRRGPVPGDPATELDAALERFVGQRSAARLPYDRAGLDAAAAQGRLVAEAAPTSPFRAAVTELAAAIAGVPAVSGRRRRR